MCIKLTLTLRTGQGQMQICQSNICYNQIFVTIAMFSIVVTIGMFSVFVAIAMFSVFVTIAMFSVFVTVYK